MPTYDYQCEKCGTFECVQRMSDPHLAKCPTCGGPVRRLISPGGGLIFKGTGFYITDYRKQEYKDQAKEESRSAGEKSSPAGEAAAPKADAPGGEGKSAAAGPAAPAAPSSAPSPAPSPPKSGGESGSGSSAPKAP